MKPRKPLRRTRIKRPLGTPEFLDHGFLDRRSYIETRTGRVVLFGRDKTNLRRQKYVEAGGRCQIVRDGKPCGKFVRWDGIGKGDLVHVKRDGRKWDTLADTELGCHECHFERDHPGVQWSKRDAA